VAVDAGAKIYVTNLGTGTGVSITVYASGAHGNAAPVQTIAGPNTALSFPAGIAVDQESGDIYVADTGLGSPPTPAVRVFAANANGNVAPIATIAGAGTGIVHPNGVALDSGGNIYISEPSSILVFAPGSNGNVAPIRTIGGSKTLLNEATGLAFDASSNLYVSNIDEDIITVYGVGTNGNAKPIRTIVGAKTHLGDPLGVAVDAASGNTYASNASSAQERFSITVYAPGTVRNAPVLFKIAGAKTHLFRPGGIAIH
jgi:sugar lactone lactonase YvrE